MNKKHKKIAILSVVFVLFRLPYVFLWQENLPIEVLHIGTIAKDLIEGLIMPLWDYQFSSYDGGLILVGILLIPFFLLFGYTTISYFILAILFSLGTLIIWHIFLRKHFNDRVALIFSLLYIISPLLFTRYSIFLLGSHMEISLFNILTLTIFYDVFFVEETKLTLDRTKRNVFVLGILCGVGTWFCYSFLVTLFIGFLFWYLCSKKLDIPIFISFAGGVLAGVWSSVVSYSYVCFCIK